jgi:hypothetical protein
MNVLGAILDSISDIFPIFYHLSLFQYFFCSLCLKHLLLAIITKFTQLNAPFVYVEHPHQPYSIFYEAKESKCDGTEKVRCLRVGQP